MEWNQVFDADDQHLTTEFTLRQPDVVPETRVEPEGTGGIEVVTGRHLFVLHGWGNVRDDMQPWVKTIQGSGAAAGRHVWNLGYDYRQPFPHAARDLLQLLDAKVREGHRFEDVAFLCYSMGGLVARQMIAQGFPVSRLATVCSPHGGMMYGWVFPTPDAGVASLKQGSAELRALNNNAREGALRGRYMLASVAYKFRNPVGSWDHDDDTAVDGWSARGDGLGAMIRRRQTKLQYEGGVGVAVGAPHKEGLDPRWFPEVLAFLKG